MAELTHLSPNFTLEELSFSEIAARRGYDNTPNSVQVANLTRLCVTLLEPARKILGVPIRVNRGFRSPQVNLIVGSTAKHSAHLDGRAADIVPVGIELRRAFDALRTNLTGWDTIILECNAWIHLAVPNALDKPRGEAMLASGTPGNWTYTLA